MENEIKLKKYKVLNPISIGGRVERGAIVKLTEKEAKNIGDHYLEEVGGEKEPIDPVEGDKKKGRKK